MDNVKHFTVLGNNKTPLFAYETKTADGELIRPLIA